MKSFQNDKKNCYKSGKYRNNTKTSEENGKKEGWDTKGLAGGPQEKALGRLVAEVELLDDGVPQILERLVAGVLEGLVRPIHEPYLDAFRLRLPQIGKIYPPKLKECLE